MNLILTLALKAYHLLWIPGKIGDVPDHLGLSRMIVIVGAGLGGTATAIRLLQFAREPAQIVVIERRSEYRNAGPAYHRDSNHWHHVFALLADMDYYVRRLSAPGFMMCTAELRQLARSSGPWERAVGAGSFVLHRRVRSRTRRGRCGPRLPGPGRRP